MAFIGYGCDFKMSVGGGGYNTVGQVTDLNLPDFKAKDVDNSNIQMANPWRSFQSGLVDPGMVKFKLIFKKSDYNTLFSNIRVSNNFQIVFSDIVSTASILQFAGYISGLDGAAPLDDKIELSVTIKLSGLPAFTQGT